MHLGSRRATCLRASGEARSFFKVNLKSVGVTVGKPVEKYPPKYRNREIIFTLENTSLSKKHTIGSLPGIPLFKTERAWFQFSYSNYTSSLKKWLSLDRPLKNTGSPILNPKKCDHPYQPYIGRIFEY